MPLPQYQIGQAFEYVRKQGWEHRQSGEQVVLRKCPFCNEGDWKFYINDKTGLWLCHRASCGKKGNYFWLLRELGDLSGEEFRALRHQPDRKEPLLQKKRWPLDTIHSYELALASDQDAIKHLTEERGLTLETAKAWHLGVKETKDGKALLMPYIANGEIVDVKYRSLPPAPKAYWRKGGGESVLWGEHTIAEAKSNDVLYLCEGEIDAMTLWQHGYAPVVSTTTGAGSFKPRWHDIITAFNPKEIVVIYDSDVAGQSGAEQVIKKFSERAVKNIVLPTKDANEFFLTHTNEDLDALIGEAKAPEVEYVYSLDFLMDQLETKLFLGGDAFDGYPSQFDELNEMIAGGYWNSQVTTISGASGTGKTSFVLQELYGLAEQRGIPGYMICIEMPAEMMLRKLLEHKFKKDKLKIEYTDIQAWRPVIKDVPFWIGDHAKDVDELEKIIRAAVKRYDLKFLAFDNINFFVRARQFQTQEVGILTKRIKELAVELGVAFINIAQPTKFNTEERTMTGNDLAWAAAIQQDSDAIILLHRRRIATSAKDVGKSVQTQMGNMSPYTLVRVDKARYSAGGEFYLYFDGKYSTYRPLTSEERERLSSD